MSRLRRIMTFLGSKTLLVWLVALFVLYYLTMAVWLGESFARYVVHLSSNNFLRFSYVLFFVNVLLLTVASLGKTGWASVRTLLRLPLLAGFLLLLASFFLSLNVRDFRWLLIGRGDTVALPWEQTQYRVDSIDPALKKKVLRGPDSAIFDYEPAVVLADEGGGQHRIGAYPPRLVGAGAMHVLNFGIGPGVEMLQHGQTVHQGYYGIRLVPLGVEDDFKIEPYPYTFKLKILPSEIIKRGKETANSYDLDKPVYRVTVTKGDAEIATAETAEGLSFDDGMAIRFHPPDDWVMLEAVYDPFMPWLAFSIALLFGGSILYPLSYFIGRRNRRGERGKERDAAGQPSL